MPRVLAAFTGFWPTVPLHAHAPRAAAICHRPQQQSEPPPKGAQCWPAGSSPRAATLAVPVRRRENNEKGKL